MLLDEVVFHFAAQEQLRYIERIACDTELGFKQKIERFMFVVGKRLSTVSMSQPVLLQALYEKVVEFPSFELSFHTSVIKLIIEEGAVKGVTVKCDET